MSFEVNASSSRYLFVRFFDVVNANDFGRLVEEVEAIEKSMPVTPNRVTDVTSVTSFDIKFSTVLDLAKRRKARTFPNRFKSAIIAKQPVEVGFARMFQTLNDHPQIEIRIVQSLQEATDWFAAKPAI